MNIDLAQKPWWDYLGEDLQELLKEAFILVEKAEGWNERFHDYSFIVFPASKAYEGFLKKLFFDMKFISEADYYGRRFRIGKALNPELEKRFREKESVYDKLVNYCQGKALPDKLWQTWKEARNTIFHWFPDERKVIGFEEARERIKMIIDSLDMAFATCKIK